MVDGSGSMSGRPEEQARDAALFFVKDLPHSQGAARPAHRHAVLPQTEQCRSLHPAGLGQDTCPFSCLETLFIGCAQC